ncbi:MAG: biotin/lipoyl-binding protein [Pseudomonadota bacterium]
MPASSTPSRPLWPRLFALASLLLAPVGPALAEPFEVTTRSVADYRPVFGTVESVDRAEARVRIAGTLQTLEVAEGDEVERGQELARVVDDKLALELQALDTSLRALDAQASVRCWWSSRTRGRCWPPRRAGSSACRSPRAWPCSRASRSP